MSVGTTFDRGVCERKAMSDVCHATPRPLTAVTHLVQKLFKSIYDLRLRDGDDEIDASGRGGGKAPPPSGEEYSAVIAAACRAWRAKT